MFNLQTEVKRFLQTEKMSLAL